MQVPTRRRTLAIVAISAIALVGIDLGSKSWAEASLSAPRPQPAGPACQPYADGRLSLQRVRTAPVVLIADHVELRYTENCGASFGASRSGSPLVRRLISTVTAVPTFLMIVVANAVLLLVLSRGQRAAVLACACALFTAGVFGNLIDRLWHGYVIDFIRIHNLHLGPLDEWPPFNLADLGITVGGAGFFLGLLMLAIDVARRRTTEPPRAPVR